MEHTTATSGTRRFHTKRLPVFGLAMILSLAVASAPSLAQDEQGEASEASEVSPERARMHLAWGQRYLKNKQYEDAETQLTKAYGFDPENHKVNYYLGRLYNETDRPEKAVEHFTKSIEQNPEKSAQSSHYKNAYYYLGDLYTRLQDTEGAVDAYTKLLEMDTDAERQSGYLHHLVTLYVESGDYETALVMARKWGELKPDDPNVQDTIAKLALQTGEEDEALEQMQKLLEANPNDFVTLDRLAEMYRERGMSQEAFAAYERLSKNDPENGLYLDYLLELSGQLNKSSRYRRDLLQRMLKLQPTNMRVLEMLIDQTGDQGLLNRALRLDPKSGKLNYLKGEHYFDAWKKSSAQKDSVEALNWFRKALTDPVWAGNAQRMIDELDPPLTDEEKALREFFKKKEKKDDAGQKGKK